MSLFPEPPPSTPGGRGTPLARVHHLPADHPYVRHLDPPPGVASQFLTLPDQAGPVPVGSWRPAAALDPAWIAAHAAELDVVHLHFGYEHLDAAAMTAWAAAVHRAGLRLVVTVHDLDNPHLLDQAGHRATVGAAVAAADRVVSLTRGAASEIHRRWGRTAAVIVHPHVLPLDLVGTRAVPRRTGGVPRLGLPLGSLRANVRAGVVLDLLTTVDSDVRIRVSRSVFDASFTRGDAANVRARLVDGVERGQWHLDVVEPGEPEQQVWQWLSSLDALVLPYGWGTHSAWVEACADVGTSVIAPAVGFWHQQQDLLVVPTWATATSADLSGAVDRLREPDDPAGGGLRPTTAAARSLQREAVHAAHGAVYRG